MRETLRIQSVISNLRGATYRQDRRDRGGSGRGIQSLGIDQFLEALEYLASTVHV